ncbi:GrpB family protein [Microbulbifer spongiae]|uniref:GrpB family protein n=1 Tax=Microbulbifer spongiae TaxID=2944933 RepID=A0ABY9EAI0_9GAMM|nr:GrpB family protein [Microbulbifer sp. MI-G]WKD50049.1 GrpB family protein [Microbulbifer sp. MI-G]
MRILEIMEYQASWACEFNREKDLILDTIGSLFPEVHHIGSTSVVGLAAKPIIDILLEVDDLDALDSFNDALEEIGYIAKGENGITERRYFQKGGDLRSHHIHAFLRSSENAIRHLAFRDYLQQNPTISEEYAIMKKVLFITAIMIWGNTAAAKIHFYSTTKSKQLSGMHLTSKGAECGNLCSCLNFI